jgi:hypothetical protein
MRLREIPSNQNVKEINLAAFNIQNSELNALLVELNRRLKRAYVYVPRDVGDDVDFSYAGGDISISADFVELSLEGIINDELPKMVRLGVELKCTNANRGLRFWPHYDNESHQSTMNRISVYTQVNGSLIVSQVEVPVDANKKLYYKLDNDTWDTVNVSVQGWWL